MEPDERSQVGARTLVEIVAGFGAVLIVLLLVTLGEWGFHRDEFLYLAHGRHPAWGYWSTPPLVGFVARILAEASSPDLATVRAVSAAVAVGSMVLTALITREMGGGYRAIIFACLPFLLSPAFLRTASLFQPVVFDIFFWTLGAWVVTRYVRSEKAQSENDKWLLMLGAVAGLGMLNKYSIIFFVIGLIGGALATRHRRVLLRPAFFGAVAVAVLIAFPNVLWQFDHGLPVLMHARELAETQLVNVLRLEFLLEQVFMHLPVAFLWIAGLIWLFSKKRRRFRILGWTFVWVVLVLLVLSGKSYYTLGAYPMVFAAGAVWLERVRWPPVRWLMVVITVLLGAAISPFSVRYLPVTTMVEYGARFATITGIDAPLRWETGRVHELPQDYSDMLGWDEMGRLAIEAWHRADDSLGTLIYAENYGQAGAIDHYGRPYGFPLVVSFSYSYRLWAPDSLPRRFSKLIYVNDELGADVDSLFGRATLIGRVEHPYSRERGTGVFLLTEPDSTFPDFYARVAARFKATYKPWHRWQPITRYAVASRATAAETVNQWGSCFRAWSATDPGSGAPDSARGQTRGHESCSSSR